MTGQGASAGIMAAGGTGALLLRIKVSDGVLMIAKKINTGSTDYMTNVIHNSAGDLIVVLTSTNTALSYSNGLYSVTIFRVQTQLGDY